MIGYIELGKEIEHITPKLKNILGLDLFFIIDKSFLSRDKWEEGLKMMNRAGNWDQFPHDVVVDKTMDSIPKEIKHLLGLSHEAHQNALFSSVLENREYLGGCIKVKDAANREVGNIIAIKDFTAEKNYLRIFLTVLTMGGIILGGILFLLFYKLIDRLENNLIRARNALDTQHQELEKAHNDLKTTQSQMLQREKLASIGQLAAGVAHEINNPVGFVSSNLSTLAKYVDRLTGFIDAQAAAIKPESEEEIKALRKKLKLDYVAEDAKDLVKESVDGTDRIKKIVQGLKNFSRVDQAEHKPANINECVEDTLNIVWNELKYKATVQKDYGNLPFTKCYPQQLNQVFMNLLVNAAHAIEKQGEIGIKTWQQDDSIYVSISDTGSGIDKENLNKLFEPFFTTKEVGKGTGLGLSIAYDIIKKHGGDIVVDSKVGKGTTFTVTIPVIEG